MRRRNARNTKGAFKNRARKTAKLNRAQPLRGGIRL